LTSIIVRCPREWFGLDPVRGADQAPMIDAECIQKASRRRGYLRGHAADGDHDLADLAD